MSTKCKSEVRREAKDALKDASTELLGDYKVPILLFILLVVGCFIYEAWDSHNVEANFVEGKAVLTSINSGEPYLYAPVYGGRVVEYTPTLLSYVYEVGGIEYSIRWADDKYKGEIGNHPEYLDIKYNKNKPENVIVNQAPLWYGDDTEREMWIKYK